MNHQYRRTVGRRRVSGFKEVEPQGLEAVAEVGRVVFDVTVAINQIPSAFDIGREKGFGAA
jgi:hypothetical protein